MRVAPWIAGLLLAAGASAKDPELVDVTFALEAPPSARAAFVAGEFNGWAPDAWPMTRDPDGVFRRGARLAPGVYRYKFVVDGAWTHDPKNPRRDADGHRNSVLVVGDVPPPALEPRGAPRPSRARKDAFHVLAPEALGTPPPEIAPRPVYVYLPPSYGTEPERRYPVLYAHDGQNVWSEDGICFGHGGWYLDEALDRLTAAGEVEEVLLVGVPHGEDRLGEYGRRSKAYGEFLLANVKAAVDRRFRTKAGPEHTALIGSSMGGLVSFELALTAPELFGKAACLSPSFWFGDEQAFASLRALQGTFDVERRGVKRRRPRLYLDSGTAGPSQDGAPATRRMRDALVAAGWRLGDDLQHHEAEGATHDERAWRARVDLPLRYLFGRR